MASPAWGRGRREAPEKAEVFAKAMPERPPIRPSGTFPRTRGKGKIKHHSMCQGTKSAARIATKIDHLAA